MELKMEINNIKRKKKLQFVIGLPIITILEIIAIIYFGFIK